MTVKTTLAPNAPWYNTKPKLKLVKKPRVKGEVDDNFEMWVSKQKDVLLTGSMLGVLPNKKEAK